MAVQKRNSEMVDLLRADFIHKNDTAYLWNSYQALMGAIPGIIGFWGMGAINRGNFNYLSNQSVFDASNNRIGIGTTAPTTKLYIDNGTVSAGRTELVLASNSPNITLYEKDGSADSRYWDIVVNGEILSGRAVDDANSTAGTWLTVERTTYQIYRVMLLGQHISFTGELGDGWIALPLTNSGGTTWANLGGWWQVAQYKKVGDIVFIRGLVGRSVGAGVTVANLPFGYRPTSYTQLRGTISNNSTGRLEIDVSGNLNVDNSIYAGWISLDTWFSVT